MKFKVPETNILINGNAITLLGVNIPRTALLSVIDVTAGGVVLYSVMRGGMADFTQGADTVVTLTSAPTAGHKLRVDYDDGRPALLAEHVNNKQFTIPAANTPFQVPGYACLNGVLITADEDNAADIYVGGADVNLTRGTGGNGRRLIPGAARSYPVPITSELYVTSSVAGQVFCIEVL